MSTIYSGRQPYIDYCNNEFVQPINWSAGGILIALIIIAVIIVLFVLVFWITANDAVTDPPIVPIPQNETNSIISTVGASKNGKFNEDNGIDYSDQRSCLAVGPTTTWDTTLNINTGRCDCDVPFYGPQCFLESYNQKYVALGQITPEQASYDVLATTEKDRLSFSFYRSNSISTNYVEEICTDACTERNDCIGVEWESQGPPDFGIDILNPLNSTKGKCVLITDKVVFTPNVPLTYDLTKQANIYMKEGTAPEVKDRVFVINGTVPLRYWLADSYADNFTNMIAFRNAVQSKLTYYPETLINSTGGTFLGTNYGSKWRGLASTMSISGNLNDIYNTGDTDTIKIIPPGTTDLTTIIPTNWQPYMVFWNPDDNPVI